MQKDNLYKSKGSDGRRTTKACLLGAERKLTFHCWQRLFRTSLSPTTRDSANLEDDPLQSWQYRGQGEKLGEGEGSIHLVQELQLKQALSDYILNYVIYFPQSFQIG